MKIFYFRKNSIMWGIVFIVVIIVLLILMRVISGGASSLESESTFMIANNLFK